MKGEGIMLQQTFKLDIHVECPAAILVFFGLLLGSVAPSILTALEPLLAQLG